MCPDISHLNIRGDLIRTRVQHLEGLNEDCKELLSSFKADTPNLSNVSPDAVLAIIDLQEQIRARLRRLYALLEEDEATF